MHLVSIIPATRIPLPAPQTLTYFTAHQLNVGSLVLVPVGKKKVAGIVVGIKSLTSQKMGLRKADFALRGILKVISKEPILDEKQIEFAKWISEYYWAPLGIVIKMTLPKAGSSRGAKVTRDLTVSQRDRVLQTRDDKISQTLILVPEISTIQGVLKQYKNSDAAILHSGLTDKQYFENWLKVKTGEVKTIIGTRLTLFAPFVNLKEIIVEEEHNPNYKSQQTPRLHTRETALKLAELWNAKITCKSATPSIETQWLAENKKVILKIPSTQYPIPNTQIIDLRQELKQGNFSIFSRELQEKIKTALIKKQQIILFINRRGASTFVLCRDCGFIVMCSNCHVPMVYHLYPISFVCHHCGHREKPPSLCLNCQGSRIKFFGIGTQKVETELKKLLPDIRLARLDSDALKDEHLRFVHMFVGNFQFPKHEQMEKIINDWQRRKINILIGTQMIFNKNLRPAPLIAVISADTLLNLPDFRSNERTFQILNLLKNLAKKDFIIQTYTPENAAIQATAKNDYQSFYQKEIKARKLLGYPPFTQLIKLIYKHKDQQKAVNEAKILTEKIKQQMKLITHHSSLIAILGPAPAFVPKVKNKYIWQIILKFIPRQNEGLALSQVEGLKIKDLKIRNQILKIIPPSWTVDVDPLQII